MTDTNPLTSPTPTTPSSTPESPDAPKTETTTDELPNQTAGSPLVSRITEETQGAGHPLIPSTPDYDPLEGSRWLDKVDEDNALDTNNEAYVGVSPEYMNHADDSTAPMLSEDDLTRKSELEARDVQASLARPVFGSNPAMPYDPETVHPSEKTKPQDKYIEGNRALMDRAIER